MLQFLIKYGIIILPLIITRKEIKTMTDTEIHSEERIYRDVNGFYIGQIRFLPLDPWEPCDGWRSFCCSSSLEWVRERIRPEFLDRPVERG